MRPVIKEHEMILRCSTHCADEEIEFKVLYSCQYLGKINGQHRHHTELLGTKVKVDDIWVDAPILGLMFSKQFWNSIHEDIDYAESL